VKAKINGQTVERIVWTKCNGETVERIKGIAKKERRENALKIVKLNFRRSSEKATENEL